MGYQERDYYRDEDGPQDPLGLRTMSATAKLIIVTVLVYLVDLFFGGENHEITKVLTLHSDVWLRPWDYYQFLTYGFVHDTGKIQHILGNMLGLWVFGKLLEEKMGGAALVRYYLCAIVFAGLVYAARHYFFQMGGSIIGASGGVVACVVLFCLRNPRATMLDKVLLPIPAWVFGALFVLADLFGVELRKTDGNTAFDAHLAGAAFALGVWALKINFGYGSWFDAPGRWLRKVAGWFKGRPNLRVHTDSAYSGRNDDDDLEREGDRILAKISSQGDASLTKKERTTLEQYSRLMRNKHK
jgi:membrane associated rhomboid family serine protease